MNSKIFFMSYIMLSLVAGTSLHAMEQNNSNQWNIICKNAEKLSISQEELKLLKTHSKTISNMVEDLEEVESNIQIIPLPNVSQSALVDVLNLLPLLSDHNANQQLVDVLPSKNNTLYNIIEVADYLDIPALLQTSVKKAFSNECLNNFHDDNLIPSMLQDECISNIIKDHPYLQKLIKQNVQETMQGKRLIMHITKKNASNIMSTNNLSCSRNNILADVSDSTPNEHSCIKITKIENYNEHSKNFNPFYHTYNNDINKANACAITSVSLSPNTKYLAITNSDNILTIINIPKVFYYNMNEDYDKLITEITKKNIIPQNNIWVESTAFNNDNTQLVLATAAKNNISFIYAFDMKTQQCTLLQQINDTVNKIQFNADNTALIASAENTVYTLPLVNREPIEMIQNLSLSHTQLIISLLDDRILVNCLPLHLQALFDTLPAEIKQLFILPQENNNNNNYTQYEVETLINSFNAW